jgi:hypothetical protein
MSKTNWFTTVGMLLVIAILFISLASQGHAQEPPQTVDLKQTLEEFLKPQTTYRPEVYNLRMADGNKMTAFKRACQVSEDKEVVSCKWTIDALPSGGGDNFSSWYEATTDLAPIGYEFKESSIHMPYPRPCEAGDDAPIQNATPQDPTGNPDRSWVGHHGNGSHDAKCFLLGKDLNRATWIFGLRGGRAGGWTAGFGPDVIISGTQQQPQVLYEGARLDAIYVKSH